MNPTKESALSLLEDAELINPGPWKQHSIVVAEICHKIGENIKGVDPDKCYIYGLLHDIGRRKGITNIRHTYDGYSYLKEIGFEETGRFCITHCFPGKKIIFFSNNDLTSEEELDIRNYVENLNYDIYDDIVQLSDSIGSANGPMILEERLIESGMRNAVCIEVFQFWKECIGVKNRIENQLGHSVYSLFKAAIDQRLFK
jgi:hypothetical protein